MPEKPPADLSDHAEDFSRRYAEDLDIVAGRAMIDLTISDHQMSARDPDRNREIHSFFPSEGTGGSVSPTGQITLDSGLMNPTCWPPITTRRRCGCGGTRASGS